jgi:glycosyltransferase involved in cell wall biosynthesis
MSSFVYRQQTDLTVKIQSDGWANVCLPDDPIGIGLDPVLSAVWSAAEGHALTEVAHLAGVPVRLASYALTTLQHAGLLVCKEKVSTRFPDRLTGEIADLSVAPVILHRRAGTDLAPCLESVWGQACAGLLEAIVIATVPVAIATEGLRVVECDNAHLTRTLAEQLTSITAEAILLLDSQVSLVPGLLAELIHALKLSGPVAAVVPRVMWRRWPSFVASIGVWRYPGSTDPDPYAGLMDVGQFGRRWQTVPAVSFGAVLLSSVALQQIGVTVGISSLNLMGIDWCDRARREGYLLLAASQALAYGPWTEEDSQVEGTQGRVASSHRDLSELVPSSTIPTVHEGAPALTLENVRAVYGQYLDVNPTPVRRQIALVAEDTPRHQAMARMLGERVDVSWLMPRYSDDATRRQVCESADLVITTAAMLEEMAFLQSWHRPVVVDTHPPPRNILSPHLWPQVLDGLICASAEEHQYWQSKLTLHEEPGLRDLVVMVPTGVEPVEPAVDLGLRQTHPEIRAEEKLILWCGGWQSFDDSETLLHALAEMRATHDNVKLVFATFDDDEQGKAQESKNQTARLTAELGLTRLVLFAWDVPAHLRSSYLGRADLGVVLRTDALEAKLREPAGVAGAIGAGLPLVMTSGSAGSGIVEKYGLGHTVPAGGVSTLAQTLAECLQVSRSEYREQFEEAQGALAWSQVISPLIELCQRHRFALEQQRNLFLDIREMVSPPPEATALAALPVKAWEMLSGQGPRATIREVSRYIRWKVGM